MACGIGVLLFLLQKTRKQVQKNQACFTNFDRLTGIGNKAKFLSDGIALHSLDSRAVVSVYLGRYSELYNLFGAPVADGIITKFCHDFVTFASTHGGQAYRIAFNHLVLVVSAENGKASFLSDLKQFLQKAEQLSITLADASYTYDFLLQYGVYLLSESNDQGTDLPDILLQLDRKIQHSTLTCAADCIVLDGDDRPDWTLFRALENDAKTAWANQEFVPYYQPIFDINTGKVVGGELLARWQHPTRGLLKPNQFVPILERNGLIVDLDLYMLEAACKKIQYWLDNGILTVPLAINLSALNIHRNDFVDRLVRLVKKYDIPPVLLELELPEDNLLFEDNSAFLEKMQYLQNKGFSLSMGH
ncbi:MAG: EAL domain-containing protein, partial [Angelakisella sp.]